VKGVNAKSLPIHGVARGTPIQISQRNGKVDITGSALDDKKFYLGIDFLDAVKEHLVSYTDTFVYHGDGATL